MNYEIKRTKRKTISLQVYQNQRVLIRAPLRCSDEEIAQFYWKHSAWVENKIKDAALNPGLPMSQYRHNEALWLLGQSILIQVAEGTKSAVKLEDKTLIVQQTEPSNEELTQRLIARWKRKFALTIYSERIQLCANKFPIELPHYEIKLRKMRRQWGNCNNKKMITINTQLIRYPLDCIDYVLVHELTHLKHLNHSHRFYSLMERVMPDWHMKKQLLTNFSG